MISACIQNKGKGKIRFKLWSEWTNILACFRRVIKWL